ncbi:hypothetical protein Tco_0368965 [Tanacetum coccineum]
MAEGEIDNLTMEQYLALTRGNQAPGVVKPEIRGNVNFEIKSQFMRELREDTFSGNKNDDAHEHVERVLDIVSLFNIPGVSHDAVMLRVFPITLTGAAKRWVDRLPPGTVDSWDLLKKAFIQRYCPPSRTAKQLEEIRNFKQEGDETLYQAWERYNDLLYKCPTHDINNHQKVNIFYNGLGAMNRQLLDSQGPIPGMTHVQALTAIQTMADHSQKWHDGSSIRNIESSSNSEGIATIVNKLENLGRDMKKLKENVHAIQVGCQNCGGAHLDKDCPLKEEVKSIKEAKYEAKLRGAYEQTPRGINAKKDRDGRIDFVVMDMLNTHNETMILGRPFLATIHAEIDVFNKEISLGIRGDRVTFDMDKKIHEFITPIGEIYMINTTSNTPSDASSRVEETNDVHTYQEQGRSHEYELGVGKKGHMLEDIWENCKKVQGDSTYWWHDQKSEEEERRQLGIDIEEYDPPMVHVETFEVKRYSFDTGQNFICVTKELMDALPLGRENGSRFRDMIRKEVDSGRRIRRKT